MRHECECVLCRVAGLSNVETIFGIDLGSETPTLTVFRVRDKPDDLWKCLVDPPKPAPRTPVAESFWRDQFLESARWLGINNPEQYLKPKTRPLREVLEEKHEMAGDVVAGITTRLMGHGAVRLWWLHDERMPAAASYGGEIFYCADMEVPV